MVKRYLLVISALAVTTGCTGGAPSAPSSTATAGSGLSGLLSRSGISGEDFNIMQAEARKLFASGSPAVGQSGSWTNPDTGASGEVRIADISSPCVQIEHRVVTGTSPDGRTIRTQRCETVNGDWSLEVL